MKTAELTGALLDYWVARAEGYKADELSIVNIIQRPGYVITGDGEYVTHTSKSKKTGSFSAGILPYSRHWSYGGTLIEKYDLIVAQPEPGNWFAKRSGFPVGEGDTPLQAICRAVVRAAFGDEVEEVAV